MRHERIAAAEGGVIAGKGAIVNGGRALRDRRAFACFRGDKVQVADLSDGCAAEVDRAGEGLVLPEEAQTEPAPVADVAENFRHGDDAFVALAGQLQIPDGLDAVVPGGVADGVGVVDEPLVDGCNGIELDGLDGGADVFQTVVDRAGLIADGDFRAKVGFTDLVRDVEREAIDIQTVSALQQAGIGKAEAVRAVHVVARAAAALQPDAVHAHVTADGGRGGADDLRAVLDLARLGRSGIDLPALVPVDLAVGCARAVILRQRVGLRPVAVEVDGEDAVVHSAEADNVVLAVDGHGEGGGGGLADLHGELVLDAQVCRAVRELDPEIQVGLRDGHAGLGADGELQVIAVRGVGARDLFPLKIIGGVGGVPGGVDIVFAGEARCVGFGGGEAVLTDEPEGVIVGFGVIVEEIGNAGVGGTGLAGVEAEVWERDRDGHGVDRAVRRGADEDAFTERVGGQFPIAAVPLFGSEGAARLAIVGVKDGGGDIERLVSLLIAVEEADEGRTADLKVKARAEGVAVAVQFAVDPARAAVAEARRGVAQGDAILIHRCARRRVFTRKRKRDAEDVRA